MLVTHGADVSKEGFYYLSIYNAKAESVTPLHLAAFRNDTKIAEYLLSKGADVSVRNKEGKSSLHIAAVEGNFPMVKLLASKGANVNSKDNSGKTPLHYTSETQWFLYQTREKDFLRIIKWWSEAPSSNIQYSIFNHQYSIYSLGLS